MSEISGAEQLVQEIGRMIGQSGLKSHEIMDTLTYLVALGIHGNAVDKEDLARKFGLTVAAHLARFAAQDQQQAAR